MTSLGTEFVANPDESADVYYGFVWVQLTAVAGAIPPSSIDIHAYIVDQEGYYAATEFGEYPLGDFHVTLTATTVPRENNSVALVLDRSGSMASPAGGTSSKSTLLKNAVSVFNSLLLPNDEIALVSFDDQIATPASMQAVSGGAVPPVLAGTDLDPRGLTCIGGGILQGTNELGAATHTNRSMVVLTDGIENVHPYVAELPAGTITNRTYAIGFGLPGDVSTAVLQEITANTHGDLIITGNIATAEQGFDLTKYFVQVLAGVSRMDVLLDPQGSLFFGSQHVIPFDVTDADIYANIMALCPLPQALDFTLETPSGKIIKPSTGGPNVSFLVRPQVAFYRLTLPALPADPLGSHAGKWKAILALKTKGEIAKLLRNREIVASLVSNPIRESLPYSLVAHSYSNLRFDASLQQESLRPGANVVLRATLELYDVPFTDDAAVWAEVTGPDTATMTIKLNRVADGVYSASFIASLPGVYSCRVRAEGYFDSRDRFTREKRLTAQTYYGNYGTMPPGDDALCDLLHCLTSEKVLTPRAAERLHELGVDVKAFKACTARLCMKRGEHVPPKFSKLVPEKPERLEPKMIIASEPPAQPIRVPKMKPMKRAAPSHVMLKAGKPEFPRIIRMFSRPEEGGEGETPPRKRKAARRKRR